MAEENVIEIPDIPGEIFKDVTLKNDWNKVKGLYTVGFARNGKKIIKLLEFDEKNNKLTYLVYTGTPEQQGKTVKAVVEPEMPFYAYTENAIAYAMMNV